MLSWIHVVHPWIRSRFASGTTVHVIEKVLRAAFPTFAPSPQNCTCNHIRRQSSIMENPTHNGEEKVIATPDVDQHPSIVFNECTDELNGDETPCNDPALRNSLVAASNSTVILPGHRSTDPPLNSTNRTTMTSNAPPRQITTNTSTAPPRNGTTMHPLLPPRPSHTVQQIRPSTYGAVPPPSATPQSDNVQHVSPGPPVPSTDVTDPVSAKSIK